MTDHSQVRQEAEWRLWAAPGVALVFGYWLERRDHPLMLPWSCPWNDLLRKVFCG